MGVNVLKEAIPGYNFEQKLTELIRKKTSPCLI